MPPFLVATASPEAFVNRVEVVRDQDEVKVVEAAKLQEPLPPIESLLDLRLAELLVVDGDELIHELKRIEHFVYAVWIYDLGPLHL